MNNLFDLLLAILNVSGFIALFYAIYNLVDLRRQRIRLKNELNKLQKEINIRRESSGLDMTSEKAKKASIKSKKIKNKHWR